MIINTEQIMSVTEVNRNFSKAEKLVGKKGKLLIFKGNKPKYMLVDLDQEPQIEMSNEEKILFVGKRILEKHKSAFKELAK